MKNKQISQKELVRRDRQSQIAKYGYFVQGSYYSGNFAMGYK